MKNKKVLLVCVAKAIQLMWKELPYAKFAVCIRDMLPDYVASAVIRMYATHGNMVGLHALVDELRKEEELA